MRMNIDICYRMVFCVCRDSTNTSMVSLFCLLFHKYLSVEYERKYLENYILVLRCINFIFRLQYTFEYI